MLWYHIISATNVPEERFIIPKTITTRPEDLIIPFLRLDRNERIKDYGNSFKRYFFKKAK
jgi:hypothetical protein